MAVSAKTKWARAEIGRLLKKAKAKTKAERKSAFKEAWANAHKKFGR